VSHSITGVERYDPARHDVAGFACGTESLDRWLVRYVGQSQRRDAARTFVATTGDAIVSGYYSLVAGQITHEEATEAARRGLSRHFPIPVAILARLAVDQRHHGQGIGAALLNDALRRVSHATELIAVRAVVVHAIDDEAAGFYRRFGFRALSTMPLTLMITLGELREAGY
jgi:GNAT superfamily N-acetyltransferase